MLIISMTVFGTLGLFVRNISLQSGEFVLYHAVLVSVIVLRESMGVMQVVGGAMILGFTLWNEISPRSK